MSFAQFAMYKSSSSSKASVKDDNSGHEEVKGDDENMDDSDDGYNTDTELNDDQFNYVMTHKNKKDYKQGMPLPEYIVLSNPYPGEPHMMKKRRFPAVLRFNKTNPGNNPKKYMLGELMLYKPVTEEIQIDQVEVLYDEMY